MLKVRCIVKIMCIALAWILKFWLRSYIYLDDTAITYYDISV